MKGSFGREDGADMVYFPRKETLRFIFDNQAEHGRWTVLFFYMFWRMNMPSHKVHFTQDELRAAFTKNLAPAEKIVEGGKMNEFISQVKEWLKKAEGVPVLGKIIDDVVTMIELLQDYADKSYTDIPVRIIISVVAVLIYVISPVDLIPDFIPVVGYIDDVAIVLFVLDLGLSGDLKAYKVWREQIQKQNYNDFIDQMRIEIEQLCNNQTVAAIFVNDEFDSLKLLFSDDEEAPLECSVRLMPIPKDIMEAEDIKGEDNILKFYNDVADKSDIQWSVLGKKSIIRESQYDTYEDDFTIIDEETSDD